MPKLFYVLVAITIGGILALQPAMNADVARRIGNPLGAGLISVFVSFVTALLVVFGSGQRVAWGTALTMPWYLWLAGTIGVIFVVGALWVVPILGAALLFASVVAGQMIVAFISDVTGISGYSGESFSPWRLAGIVLVLAGVWVFQRAA